MDQKRAILNYISDESLDLLEELNETEVKLKETIATLQEMQVLSAIMENYLSVVESIENMLNDLKLKWIGRESVKVDKFVTGYFNNGSFKSHNTQQRFDQFMFCLANLIGNS